MRIDFGQFITALSDTVDLVGVDEIQHGKRVGYMALVCAELMGASTPRRLRLFRLGLLHDCGVSSTRVHRQLVDELDWTESHLHCQLGANRLQRFEPLATFAEVVLHHHTRWDALQNQPLDQSIKEEANLIFLLDRVDAISAMSGAPNRLASRDLVCDRITQFRGSYFRPELVDLFLAAAATEAFWITQQPEHLPRYLQQHCTAPDELSLDTAQLTAMARIFAEVVDAKSPYTAEHSLGVTALSGHLARGLSIPEPQVAKIKVAGLLHDLGKLQVPDWVLEHRGSLAGENLAIMRHHSYVTAMILNRIKGLEEISRWAANHHEKLDGSGYPFHRKESELSIESRIIMVADIFQALAQNRPYRKPMATSRILELLQAETGQGKLDQEVVDLVMADPETCHRIATCRPPHPQHDGRA